MPKKGSRTIRVDGRVYRWTLSPDSGYMVLVVEPDDQPGQRVCLSLPYGDVVVGSTGPGYETKQLNTVTPGVVRRGILWAIDHGWSPGHRGPELRLDGAGDELFGDVMS